MMIVFELREFAFIMQLMPKHDGKTLHAGGILVRELHPLERVQQSLIPAQRSRNNTSFVAEGLNEIALRR